jgi:hypothetical protein
MSSFGGFPERIMDSGIDLRPSAAASVPSILLLSSFMTMERTGIVVDLLIVMMAVSLGLALLEMRNFSSFPRQSKGDSLILKGYVRFQLPFLGTSALWITMKVSTHTGRRIASNCCKSRVSFLVLRLPERFNVTLSTRIPLSDKLFFTLLFIEAGLIFTSFIVCP